MEGVLPEVPPAAAWEVDGVEASIDGGQYRRMLLWEGVHEEGGRREGGEGEEIDDNHHAVTAIVDVFDGDWSNAGATTASEFLILVRYRPLGYTDAIACIRATYANVMWQC